MIIAIVVLTIIGALLFFLLLRKMRSEQQQKIELTQARNQFESFKLQYKDIVDVNETVSNKNRELMSINSDIANLTAEFDKKKEQLNLDFQSKRDIYQKLLDEISIVEESLETISYGLYKPYFDFNTSEEYKHKLELISLEAKEMAKNGLATYCPTEWEVGGSKVEGRKMIKNQSKLMLRAFNGECDSAISKVNWNNVFNVEARILKAYEAINNLASTQNIIITKKYADLKLQELRLEFELEEKIYKEKEEQRKIREQMREEEKALREIDKARNDAEKEEEKYQKVLDKAREEANNVTGAKLEALNEKIKQLESSLQNAHDRKERAISQAQLTKSGHVYIISNIGSFGDHIYKIGMTRRIEPLDRINELGDASVPFDFDVHGMIYSENAPELENILHKRFDHKRLNLVNRRAEFFNVTIDEIESIVTELNLSVQLTKLAEAKEHRATLSIRAAKEKEANGQVIEHNAAIKEQLKSFPTSLE